ncbi:large ribosomal subunit protein eL20z-like [Bidens hawaiensis]|uniref:large ribosomal subunit protein eL20z-like n=1 Tax=Bidens hawaiensis TaxID=980011 RepID=UPI004049C3B2
MSSDGKTSRGVVEQQQSINYYGTFQGVANHPPPPVAYQPAVGLPQPPPHIVNINYAHGYQTVPGIVIAPGTPVVIDRRPLPCCGCGVDQIKNSLAEKGSWAIGLTGSGLAILALIAIGLGVQGAKYGW